MVDLTVTPELRYEATRTLQADFSAVSRATPNPAVAIAAQWASDVCAFQEFLWETAIIASPDIDAEFEKINTFVTAGLTNITSMATYQDAADLLTAAKHVVADQFADPATIPGWTAKCDDASHLVGMPTPTADDWATITHNHLHGVDPAEVLRRRQDEIVELSDDLTTSRPHLGDRADHERVWLLDWTVFHAHLLDVAIRCGDLTMLSAELRWQIATHRIDSITELPMSAYEASALWRSAFKHVVGPLEASQLERHFLPI